MESVDAKLSRAREHLRTYIEEAAQFSESVEHHVILKHDIQTGAKWLVLWDSDQIPPVRLSAVAGDVLFNLRSVLDHLVCGLVRRQAPRHECDTLQFPVCRKPDCFTAALKRGQLDGVPDEARSIIKSLQPFQRPVASIDDDRCGSSRH